MSDFEIENGALIKYNGRKDRAVIPSGVISIEDRAFFGKYPLKSVVIPDTVTAIGEGAFQGCTLLSEAVIPDSVTEIGENAFKDCPSLKRVFIPSGVTEIDNGCFAFCGRLTSVNIPDGVTRIGREAFNVCAFLEELSIPDSVTCIGEGAFAYCRSLRVVSVSVSKLGLLEAAVRNEEKHSLLMGIFGCLARFSRGELSAEDAEALRGWVTRYRDELMELKGADIVERRAVLLNYINKIGGITDIDKRLGLDG